MGVFSTRKWEYSSKVLQNCTCVCTLLHTFLHCQCRLLKKKTEIGFDILCRRKSIKCLPPNLNFCFFVYGDYDHVLFNYTLWLTEQKPGSFTEKQNKEKIKSHHLLTLMVVESRVKFLSLQKISGASQQNSVWSRGDLFSNVKIQFATMIPYKMPDIEKLLFIGTLSCFCTHFRWRAR